MQFNEEMLINGHKVIVIEEERVLVHGRVTIANNTV